MKRYKNIYWVIIISLCMSAIIISCNGNKKEVAAPAETRVLYTCPMHPQIIRDQPGNCPICGMKLIKKETNSTKVNDVKLETLLKPTDEFIVSSIPFTSMKESVEQVEIEALGATAYDTRWIGNIAVNVSGRIDKLYIRYNFQEVLAGQKIMDIYSPELMTAQQNILFLIKNDPSNTTMINAAKERLLLLGVSSNQIQQIIKSGNPSALISVYSNYSGRIREREKNMTAPEMEPDLTTKDLSVKEGMYIQKGETVFSVYNPNHLWILLDIYADRQALVHAGNPVRIIAEAAPDKTINAKIDFIEPFLRKNSKTVTARVYFDNSQMHLPIGSQVRATISAGAMKAGWLDKDAVISLGLDNIVFLKSDGGFRAHKVETGITYDNKIQILSGLLVTDSVAANAQYLTDSESFIKINN
jgi:Cu(I)/Ag(I) efflux system membrane fusion protein